ncbi:hypothetical protein GTO89_15045 [Heliobacterium gestii]|uniref:ABC-three component systems C-terminal domain-containing protein n=1 Tax=Heliomicrobium gestii TaxID=2699 RepID=A0A845LDT6_HELGE|nr:ABC-three component system protein [Heliomicrobium gestii]MBM7868124.1 hypothetical protein [Heliomicrobium gestii]MZP44348.1 hypothetical protein [Heliomicrobium gestii]
MDWDASPTWSGYVYQGKVAIYHMLKVICERLEKGEKCPIEYSKDQSSNKLAECHNYLMELEKVEDFSIKDKFQNYLTLHQVKAYKTQEISHYRKAILKLVQNTNSFSNSKGYLHLIKEVPITYGNSNISTYEYIINGTIKNYCGLEEIEQLIKEKIIKIKYLLKNETLATFDTEVIYLYFMNVIDQIVRERHKNIDDFGRGNFIVAPYPFCSLCELLNTIEMERDLYYTNKLKSKFIKKFEEYYYIILEVKRRLLQEINTDVQIACTSEKNFKLHKYMCQLWNYYGTKEKFSSFCKMVTPEHKTNEKLNDDDYRALIPDNLLAEFYFPTTELLVNSTAKAKNNGVFIINQKKYIITNITKPNLNGLCSEEEEKLFKKIHEDLLRKKILNNPSNIDLLYEVDALITKEINLDRIYDDSFCDVSELYVNELENELDGGRLKNNIVHIKEDIEIISLDKLKERLNK